MNTHFERPIHINNTRVAMTITMIVYSFMSCNFVELKIAVQLGPEFPNNVFVFIFYFHFILFYFFNFL